jgi:hypothetical protein
MRGRRALTGILASIILRYPLAMGKTSERGVAALQKTSVTVGTASRSLLVTGKDQ